MAVKLADAFVQITARSEGLQKDVAKQLAGLGKVGEQVGKDAGDKFAKEFDAETKDIDGTVKKSLGGLDKFAASTGQSMGSKISSGINKTLKAGVIGVGVAAGGVLAASITKGLGRLQGIDNAQAKLAGLGHEAKAVEGIMDDALAAVKGTAFGLEDAATIAASSVAAGIKPGEDLQRTLKLTGDAATIAGTDLSTMGSIINKVATSDMMQMDVANQMMDAGIPILQMVGEELGVTAEEARKMASDGEVSFETFQSALENGLGGAALKSGDTVQGAFANMQAAAGRFGAKLAEPIFKAAPAVFGSLGGAFDQLGEKLEPLIADFADWLAPRMEAFATETIPKLVDGVMGAVDAFIEFGGWVKDNAEWIKPLAAGIGGAVAAIYAWNTATTIATGVQTIFNKVIEANKLMLIVTAVAAVVAALVYFFTQTETGREVWSKFTKALSDGWQWVQDKVGGGVDWLTEKFTSFTDWISQAVDIVKQAFGDFMSIFRKEDYDSSGIMMLLGGNQEWHDRIVGFAEKLAWVGDAIRGFWDLLTTGDADTSGIMAIFGPEWHERITGFVDTVRGAISKAGEIITAVWDGIVTAGKVAFAILGTVVLTPFILAWNYLSAKVKEGWETVIKPAWDAMSAGVTWLWENAIKPAIEAIAEKWDILQLLIGKAIFEIRLKIYEFQTAITALWLEYVQPVLDAIRSKWDQLSAAMTAAWNVIKTAVFDAWNWYVNQVKANWDTVTNALNKAWTWVKDHFTSIWNTIKTSVLDAWNTAVNFLRDTFNTITTTISDKWTWLKDQMSNVWSWIRDNVFSKFNSAIDLMRSGAEIAMDGIGKAFDWLREKTAKPVNFVIETVYMGGIRKAWGAVASLVDLEELPKIDKIGGYARGGILPGYTPGRDPFTFIEPTTGMSIGLSGGEAIMRPEATRALGSDWVDGVNAAARVGGKQGVEKFLGHFASGGVVPSIVNIVREKFPMMSITSTYRNTNDHHGAGKAVDFSNGTDSTPGMRSAAQYFAENYGRSLLELIHSPSPFNIKNGQSVGDGFGFYGAGTMNAHRNHVHVAANNPLPGGGTGGVLGVLEGAVGWVGDQVKKIWDGIINVIPKFDGGGLIGGLPGGFLSKAGDAAWSWISDKLDTIGAFFGSPGAGVEQWRPMVESVLASKGFSTDLADTVLRRMNQESGGDPRAINLWDSNATAGVPSKGLMQVIDPTFAAHKDPGFNDIWDPESNLRASMNYAVSRYGSLPAAYNRAGGYHAGGLAPAGQGLMHKTALEPEMVLSPKMTKAFIDWMKVPDGESVRIMSRELAEAFNGGDWGMGELASYIGIELAESIINGAAALGEISRTIGEQLQKSGTDYATTQATDALDVMGLGGLVPLGQKLGAKAWDLYQASPYEVGFNGQSVTVEIEAESDADLIRVSEFKRLADQVRGLDVKVNQRPSAASITRGGVM